MMSDEMMGGMALVWVLLIAFLISGIAYFVRGMRQGR